MTQTTLNALDELKQYKQWMPYGHQSKAPLNVHSGKLAYWKRDASCLLSYDEAKQACHDRPDLYKGIGFLLTKDDPFVVIDLDDCILGDSLDEGALAIVKQFHSYTEYSPGGKGVHIWIKAHIERNMPADPFVDPVEIYGFDRFMSVTERPCNYDY